MIVINDRYNEKIVQTYAQNVTYNIVDLSTFDSSSELEYFEYPYSHNDNDSNKENKLYSSESIGNMDYIGVKLCVNNKIKMITICQLVAMFIETMIVDFMHKKMSSLNCNTTDDDEYKYQVHIGICVPNSFFGKKDSKCALIQAIKMAKYNIDNSNNNKKFVVDDDNVTIISSCLAGGFYQSFKDYFDPDHKDNNDNNDNNDKNTSTNHQIIVDISETNISTSMVETNDNFGACKSICFKIFYPQSVEFVLWSGCVADAIDNLVNKIGGNIKVNNYSKLSSIDDDVRYKRLNYKKLAKLSKLSKLEHDSDVRCRFIAMFAFCNKINSVDVNQTNFNLSQNT